MERPRARIIDLPDEIVSLVVQSLPLVCLMQLALSSKIATELWRHLRALRVRLHGPLVHHFTRYIAKCVEGREPIFESLLRVELLTDSASASTALADALLRQCTSLTGLTFYAPQQQLSLSHLNLQSVRELTFIDCEFSANESFALADVLCTNLPQLRILRSINSLCGDHSRIRLKRSLTTKESVTLQRRMFASLTQLTDLAFVGTPASLQDDASVSFSRLTNLRSLVTFYEEFYFSDYNDDTLSCEGALSLLSQLRELRPAQLRAEMPRLCVLTSGFVPERVHKWPIATALHLAAAGLPDLRGWVQAWQQLGFAIDAEDSDGKTPLMWAIARTRKSPFSFGPLVEAGADVFHRAAGWRERNALFAWKGDIDLGSQLMSTYQQARNVRQHFVDSLGRNPLGVLSEGGYGSASKFRIFIDLIRSMGMAELMPPTQPSYDGGNALHWVASAAECRVEVADVLIEFGCDPFALDAKGRTPLWRARSCDFAADMLRLTIRTRDDLMKVWRCSATPPSHGEPKGKTLLMKLARLPREDTQSRIRIELLRVLKLCTPEELNAIDRFGRHALAFALNCRNPWMVQFLLDKRMGSENIVFNLKQSCLLHRAVANYSSPFNLCKLLMSHSVDLLERDRFGRTALHVLLQLVAECEECHLESSYFIQVIHLFLKSDEILSTVDAAGRVPLHWLCAALTGCMRKLNLRQEGDGFSNSAPWQGILNTFVLRSREFFLSPDVHGIRPVDLLGDFESGDTLGNVYFAVLSYMWAHGLPWRVSVHSPSSSKTSRLVIKVQSVSQESQKLESFKEALTRAALLARSERASMSDSSTPPVVNGNVP
eukprot:TRINITY_DN3229_c0_g1_i1.p1 TRINITY_DN3229_c0_g1~~TRINITY_DN3229_c0_g1_i1.p1  ORF type:complete len:829 (+),score=64.56 TRINITY_DN3229_c0_g1_i1:948-3434(+)